MKRVISLRLALMKCQFDNYEPPQEEAFQTKLPPLMHRPKRQTDRAGSRPPVDGERRLTPNLNTYITWSCWL